ncbi:hypothetical protein C6P40_004061 [Pichia californica]|uniref:Diphthine--ammonia ligase n=1 Tax=Pichia californica TaxID=460514 RepID=A0A9P6WN29_9ASCO|nr:hypothetical protein C6P42_001108 [[Candida] californica]KAG0690010.1 hypothetical protein C6P40_004061 [[Candida] californica]
MKFVALVSGGKDSCFNILHCLAQGHELVCLANLYPPEEDNDEIDSYMYQTVGHNVLSLYEKCIGKPMYRKPILGSSSNQNLEYNKTDNDETEDLYKLLSTVLENHPDVQAVSVGAILSSYQRTRVEDVCSRLGLTSLAYLWQRDQGELMNEMCQSEMEARIVKVAAIGLDETNLGMTLQEIHPTLLKLNKMFGVHICGEGGEFETTVLDAPFFKYGKITIVNKEIVKHTNDDVWYLKIKVGFEAKTPRIAEIKDWSDFIVEPPLLTETFQALYDQMPVLDIIDKEISIVSKNVWTWDQNVYEQDELIYISNLVSSDESVEGQIIDIFSKLKEILIDYKLDFPNIQSSKLLVNDMANFANINSIYVKYFTKPLPPARICVETNLPKGIHAQLSVVVLKDINSKNGLHVQGRSYWAPCNIGPYSQAISDKNSGIMRISGQIPLIPKNMELSSYDKVLSSVLSLQHYDSIKDVTGYKHNLLTICFIKNESLVEIVSNLFEEYISISDEDNKSTKNLVIVQVTQLPKNADVEWGGMCYRENNQYISYESDSEDEEDIKKLVKVSYIDTLSDFKFEDKDVFYEIYGNPEKLTQIRTQLGEFCKYEIFPVVQAFDKVSRNGSKISIVEIR